MVRTVTNEYGLKTTIDGSTYKNDYSNMSSSDIKAMQDSNDDGRDNPGKPRQTQKERREAADRINQQNAARIANAIAVEAANAAEPR